MAQKIIAKGGEAIECPTIAIKPVEDAEPLRRAARQAAGYDWIIFSSPNAVEHFLSALDDQTVEVSTLAGPMLAAIGPATRQALEDRGLQVQLTPEKFVAEDMLKAMTGIGSLNGRKILIPRAAVARDVLPDGLRQAGAEVDIVEAYRTVLNKPDNFDEIAADIESGRIDAITFTSSSTAQNFAALLGDQSFAGLEARCCLASIGPITSRTICDLGARPTIEADAATLDQLTAKLCEYFSEVK